jgi:hypothetical protein
MAQARIKPGKADKIQYRPNGADFCDTRSASVRPAAHKT